MDGIPDPRYTPDDAAIIKKKIRRLVGRHAIPSSDAEDLEQDLAIHVIKKMPKFRPERGSRSAFVNTVASNKLLNLIERRTAKKRDRRRDVQLGDEVQDREDSRVTQGLKSDLRKVLASMPRDLRKVALLLRKHSERDLEQRLHLTRGQVRSRIAKVGKLLQDAGLNPNDKF